MATIIDVAKLAGVSQGTVSNVLNRKGNVSSEKIKLVEDAAQALGYTINEKARILRKGSSNSLAVILPNIQFKQYRDFYTSLRIYAENNGYSTELMITNDNPDEERVCYLKAKAALKVGIAIISCLDSQINNYIVNDIQKVCFVERKPEFAAAYYGFDYELCGKELARTLTQHEYRNILLVHGTLRYSNEKEIVDSFTQKFSDKECNIINVSTDILRLPKMILEIFDGSGTIDAIVTTNFGFAENIHQMISSLLLIDSIPIYTVSPVFKLPEVDYKKYELNYNLLGRRVAEDIVKTKKEELEKKDNILENDGYRKWHNIALKRKGADKLNVLALEGPEALVMKGVARLYEEKTGTKINISVYSYDEIYEAFTNAEDFSIFDIFRIDVTWLSWLSDKILLPLERIDPNIADDLGEYIPGLEDQYSRVNGKLYALPVTPSAQLLFYRKDLFDDVAIKRAYHDIYKSELRTPKNFQEFNRISRFFTRSFNASSKVRYGTSLVLGNTGAAATEFLTRFFSCKKNLYSDKGKIIINNDIGSGALKNLVEAKQYINHKNLSWWTDAAKTFSEGDVAMEIMFSNYASEILGYKSKITDKVGYSIVPGGNPIIGGGSLAVAKTCKHPEDALAFIKWLTRDPVASAMAALGSVSPCTKTYDIYEIIDAFPWLELSNSQTRRLPVNDVRPFDEKRFQNIVGGMVKNVCAGVLSIEQALDIAQTMIDNGFN
mgnify:FL=1